MANSTPLTERQEKILEFIRQRVERDGIAPTIREIGRGCGISSTSVVNYHLNKLKKGGHLQRHADISRGLAVRDLVTLRIGDEVLVEIDGVIVQAPFMGPVAKAA